ncbi:MAG: hypothetical protein QOJ56_1779 [Mycobacterium sp.]|nr:hypothetical protein [Mycobacterium sp.]
MAERCSPGPVPPTPDGNEIGCGYVMIVGASTKHAATEGKSGNIQYAP